MKKLSLALVGLALIAPFGAAQAQLPAWTFAGNCVFSPANGANETVVPATPGCSVTGGLLTVATEPLVSLQANVNADMELGSTQVGGTLTFYFEVLGGTQDQQIPILVTTDLSTTSTGNGGGNASLTVFPIAQEPTVDGVAKRVCSNIIVSSCAGESASFDGTFGAIAFDGEVGKVAMALTAGGGNNVVTSGAGTASADPGMEIEPNFLLENPGLSIEFSPNIGIGLPTSPQSVPEPTSLALLATGLAALAGWWRRHPRSLALAIATASTRGYATKAVEWLRERVLFRFGVHVEL
jgi:hypothetical protein